jgi:hypothetical protein
MTNKAKSTKEIEREVEQKRAEVAANVKQLRASVSLGSVAQQIGKLGLQFTGGITSTIFKQAKQNPLPVATIAVGVAWLILGKTKTKPDVAAPVVPDLTPEVSIDMTLQEAPIEEAEPLRGTKEPETNVLTELFENHPFVVGALVLAAGAAIGSAIPRSKTEDDLAASAQDLMRAEKERLANVARKVKEEAVTIFGETKDDLDSGAPSGQTAAQAIGEHAKGAADRMMSAAAQANLDTKSNEN